MTSGVESGNGHDDQKRNTIIFENIIKHVSEWKECLSGPNDLEITKLNGMSNACYKVQIKKDVIL